MKGMRHLTILCIVLLLFIPMVCSAANQVSNEPLDNYQWNLEKASAEIPTYTPTLIPQMHVDFDATEVKGKDSGLDLHLVEGVAYGKAPLEVTFVANVANCYYEIPEDAEEVDIVFIIDSTGSMRDDIRNLAYNVNTFARKLATSYNIRPHFAIVEYKDITVDGLKSTFIHKNDDSNWFDISSMDKFQERINGIRVGGGGDVDETPIDALEMAREMLSESSSSSSHQFFVLLTDAGYKANNRYEISSMEELILRLVRDRINVSVITDPRYQSAYSSLYMQTGGIYADINSDFAVELEKIADMIGVEVTGGCTITWTWDFGNGDRSYRNIQTNSTMHTATTLYTVPGSYSVAVNATDVSGTATKQKIRYVIVDQVTYTITSTHDPNGSISPLGLTSYPENSTPAYTITPDPGYTIAEIFIDDVLTVQTTSPYVFAPLVDDHTIHVTFTSTLPATPTSTPTSHVCDLLSQVKRADIVFVLDESGSIGSGDYTLMKEIAKDLTNTFRSEDRIAVFTFDSTVRQRSGFIDKSRAESILSELSQSGGSTAIYDGIQAANDLFIANSSSDAAKVMIVLTDGQDNSSSVSEKEVTQIAKDKGIRIYTIGIGSVHAGILTTIAEETGGKYYPGASFSELEDIFGQLREEIEEIRDCKIPTREVPCPIDDPSECLPIVLPTCSPTVPVTFVPTTIPPIIPMLNVVTHDATTVIATGAILNGEVTDMGGESSVDVFFKYGTDPTLVLNPEIP